ncbi:BQ2448_6334 [Microbotryum intermedium]|uniref:BQ2448_6334 protein n=1 Tax=Microbotryum intermedium TaxID=269621 RepID=A0A238FPT8_9BASI|nr:BQ2448_6334 [Microbotryum intermedium]
MVFTRRRRSKSAAVDSSPSQPSLSEAIPSVPALPPGKTSSNGETTKGHGFIRGVLRRVKSGALHRKESSSKPQLGNSFDLVGSTTNFGGSDRLPGRAIPIPSIPPIRVGLSPSSGSLHSLGFSDAPPHLDDEFASWLEIVQTAGDSASDSTCATSGPRTPSYTNTSTSSCSPVPSISQASHRGTTELASPFHRTDVPSPTSPDPSRYPPSLCFHDDNISNKILVQEVDAEDFFIYDLDDTYPSPIRNYTQPHKPPSATESTTPVQVKAEEPLLGLGPRGIDLLDYTLLRLASSFPRSVPIPSRLTRPLHHPLSTNKHSHIEEKGPGMELRVILGRVGVARKAQKGATAHERVNLERHDSGWPVEDEIIPLSAARMAPIFLRQVLGLLHDEFPGSAIEDAPMTKTRSIMRSSLPSSEQVAQWATRPAFIESHDEVLSYSEDIVLTRPIESRLRPQPLSLSGRIRTLAQLGRSRTDAGSESTTVPVTKVQYRTQYRLPGPIGIAGVHVGVKDRRLSCATGRSVSIGLATPRRKEDEFVEDETPLAFLISRSR